MTPQDQLIAAVNNNDVDAVHNVVKDCNPVGVTIALRKACEIKHLACVEALIPYTADFFNQARTPLQPHQSMTFTPCDFLYNLMHDTVVASNNLPLFSLFKDLLIGQHMRQCPVILVRCFELGHVDLIDCLLPFVEDLSAVAQYKPQAYAFFEERKAVYQNRRLMAELGDTPLSYQQTLDHLRAVKQHKIIGQSVNGSSRSSLARKI